MNAKQARLLLAGLMTPGEWGGKGEPVAYLFNGVRLPKLPESELPYAVIRADTRGANVDYWLSFHGTNAHYFELNQWVLFGSPPAEDDGFEDDGIEVPLNLYEYRESNGVWTLGLVSGDSYVTINYDKQPVIWSNFDVEYNGTLYCKASDPIPVYE